MRAFIFRHAEKTNLAASDPALSAKGQRQAQRLLQLVQEETLPQPTRLLCSPKLRTRQTLAPLSEKQGLEIQILPELNERQAAETQDQFERRTKQALLKIEAFSGVIFMVTHLDWIEEALAKIPSDTDLLHAQFQYWPPAQYMEFEVHDGLWSLKNFKSTEG